MRAVIQRVAAASVEVESENFRSSIDMGLLVLLGVEHSDTEEDILWLMKKLAAMRIFGDEEDKMNLSVMDIDGEVMVISQFTLHASTKKGNRPSFVKAARPDQAKEMYESFCDQLSKHMRKPVHTGVFGAMMQVSLVNDGPVTIIVDSKMRE